MQTFKQKVLIFISAVPKGRVVSYGQVAAACGSPRAARQVGGILRGLNFLENYGKQSKSGHPRQTKSFLDDKDQKLFIPWWRVVNARGEISIKGNWTASKELQKLFLEKEGVRFSDDFSLSMQKYRFRSFKTNGMTKE